VSPPAVSPDLPAVRLAAEPPAGPGVTPGVLALPTRSGDASDSVAVLLAATPAGSSLAELGAVLAADDAKGSAGELVAYTVPGAEPRQRLLLVGTGAGSPADLRKAGAALARRVRTDAAVTVDLRGVPLEDAGLRAFAEAVTLASYGFTLKADPKPRQLREVLLVVADPAARQPALDRCLTIARATAVARELTNTPSLTKTPVWLAAQATALLPDLQVRVRDEAELAAEGFGGIVGVGQGSPRPPRLVEATYDGGGSRHVVLVGKGITFDTGGLSLKPSDSMLAMKSDMGGAAAVLATLRAVADLRLPLRVTALLACAENMPSGTAQRPGDVLTQYGGRTVEVLNTDAEGRLVLADALAYADAELAPDVLVDVATLTGAMPVALGKRHAGLFASDDALAAGLEAASAASGERLWRMPLVEDYRQALDSPTADLRNIGNPKAKFSGGSITAALFLREFAGGRPWAHLDIAGPSWCGGDEDELTKGATGYGVRLLVRWLEDVPG
jgi:leucyl aminopeptidase